ncbi:hypothetical protein [Blastococcus sp. PRF04-17]|uniref:hypothetical protein n=1 Tax=Blastococcus sp. PRF04-17 TaxID=2933797 RepID=UPI001FF6BD7F|nr:hypothetical protein [Blastococcus sp. PRF04-17]UOY00469.1 hypothetical protein MVA48_15890 [Blastococcus sp. PRF04-17]
MSAAPSPATVPDGRMAAVRRLQSTALGSESLQRLTGIAMRLLRADATVVCLVGDVTTVAAATGMPAGTLGGRCR